MNNHVLIIAEAGVNHNGDLTVAKQLIDVAKQAGADFVKFQTFKTELLTSKNARKAEYQKANLQSDDDFQFEMLKKLELSESMHHELIAYSKQVGIPFMSTAFDLASLAFLEQLSLPLIKIPSGEATNFPFLRAVAQKNKPTILSTGMCTLHEVREAVEILLRFGLNPDNLTVLHCNTDYPSPYTDINLKAMQHIRQELGVKVGYSDHTEGIEVSIAAVALGATVIEKHFTLNKNMEGPDHKASLEPAELKAMVQAIRNTSAAISGSGIKEPSKGELKNIPIARKSIHAFSDIKAGELITEDKIIALRPGDGISPMEWEHVIGKTATHDIEAFTPLNWDWVQ